MCGVGMGGGGGGGGASVFSENTVTSFLLHLKNNSLN